MLTAIAPEELYGLDVQTADGEKLGKVDELYMDDVTGRPDWAKVKGGFLGRRTSLVPVATAERAGDHLELPYDQERIKNAPDVELDESLDVGEEAQLFAYYGIPYRGSSATAAATASTAPMPGAEVPSAGAVPPAPGVPATGPTAVRGEPAAATASGDAMTRSEEELRVGTRQAESGRVRLHKYVTTDTVQERVPVRHEEAHIEREPITDANVEAATAGPDIAERDHEVVLHEEEPVVEKRAVPKERVRLTTEEVTDEVPVEAELRKERIAEQRDAD